MKPKKNLKFNMERNRFIFFETAVICTLLIVLLSFEWPERLIEDKNSKIIARNDLTDQTELIINTLPEQEPIPEKPRITEIINLVPDDEFNLPDPQIWDPEIQSEESFISYYIETENTIEDFTAPVDFIKVEEKPLQ